MPQHVKWRNDNGTPGERMVENGKSIVLYVVPGCPLCSDAREALTAAHLEYTERDVENDFGALRRMYKNTRQSLVPVVECDGRFFVRPSQKQILDL